MSQVGQGDFVPKRYFADWTGNTLQVLPTVSIPPNLKLWGIDSGVRHSVGGQDYGSVRTAAFMGLKILTALSKQRSRQLVKGEAKDAMPASRWDCIGTSCVLFTKDMPTD